jgi:hypothetical protein
MRKIDYFAQKPRLSFNKNYTHPTTVGGVTTLIVIGLTILTLSSFSQNFLYKTSPVISSSERNYKETPIFDLNVDKKLTMGFFLASNQNNRFVMDPSLFTIRAFQTRVYMNDDKEFAEEPIELELEGCREDHFPDDEAIKKSFKFLGIDQNLCLKKLQIKQPRLVGFWGQENFERIEVKFQRCTNGTSR